MKKLCVLCVLCVLCGCSYKEEHGFKVFQINKKSPEGIMAQGLIQIIYSNPDFKGVPKLIRLDPHPGFYHESKKPFSCIWYGSLFVEKPGEYRIGTLSDDGSWVYIDNRLVIDNGGVHGPQFIENTIELKEGLHPLEIRYFDNGGISAFKLYWGRKDIWPFHTFIPKKNLTHMGKDWETVSLEKLKNGIELKKKAYLITYLKVPEKGDYTFQIESNSPIGMKLRRRQFSSKDRGLEATIPLREKKYPLIIAAAPKDKYLTLTLSWKPPGKKIESIPEEFLYTR